jgi:hypothetical protein
MGTISDICKSRCTTGINDTGGKTAACIVDTGGKFATSVTTPVACPSFASVVDTSGKFSSGVNDTGGKFCHWCQQCRWQFAIGINNTSGKFATGVIYTSGKQWEQSDC